jgi:hypothetical protein
MILGCRSANPVQHGMLTTLDWLILSFQLLIQRSLPASSKAATEYAALIEPESLQALKQVIDKHIHRPQGKTHYVLYRCLGPIWIMVYSSPARGQVLHAMNMFLRLTYRWKV